MRALTRSLTVLASLLLLACSTVEEARPDPTSSDASSSDSSSSSSSSGSGGSTPSNTQAYSAGIRLKVRVFSAEDDSIQQLGFFDSQLSIRCTFGAAEDCTPRCLPDCVFNPTPKFYDSGCTQPVVVVAPDAECGEWRSAFDNVKTCTSHAYPNGNGQARKPFKVAGQTPHNSLFEKDEAGTCVPVAQDATNPTWEVMQEEPESSLVGAAEVILP